MKKILILLILVGLLVPLGTTGCHTHTGRMAVAGALIGAAVGSTAPRYARDRAIITGAAYGAAIGAAAANPPHVRVGPPPPRTTIIIEGPNHYRPRTYRRHRR